MSKFPIIDEFLRMAREAQAQKDRERITIGLILDVPPLQITDEQIEDYKKKLWIESMRIHLFNPFKLK